MRGRDIGEIPSLRGDSLRRHSLGAYGLALLCAGAAGALRIAIDPYVPGIHFLTFFPAIVVAAALGGFGAGLLCIVLSVIAAVLFQLPPHAEHRADVLSLLLFTSVSFGLVCLMAARKEADRLTQAGQERLQFVLDAARLGWWEYDIRGRAVRWDERARELFHVNAGMSGFEAFKERLHPDDREWVLSTIGAHAADPARSGPYVVEYRIRRDDGTMRWVEDHGLTQFHDGVAVRMVGTVQDITARKRREAERARQEDKERLLTREVNHRAKNMLSIVDAIAHNTATRDPEEFVSSLSQRIQALAANQDLLDRNQWAGADVDQLVRAQLSRFSGLIGSRIGIEGPPLILSPASAQAIGLALHELASNAAKYGALSTDAGRVRVRWRVAGDAFEMSWTEREGPHVPLPAGSGFGTTMMKKMVERSLNGEVSLDYAPAGVTWRLTCPLASAVQGADDRVRAAPAL